MEKQEIYQIDAFTDQIFGGNPACVVPLKEWLPDELLLQIAKENAVAETAFIILEKDRVLLRWFTPDIEMDLCGHATLASAHCIKSILNYPLDSIVFETMSGELKVSISNGHYHLDFPSRMPAPAPLPKTIASALNLQPKEVHQSRDYVLVYEHQNDIEHISVDRNQFDQINLGTGGVIVTAPGINCDFISRFFTPQATILEDPVTGSAHCSLIPFWSKRLGKNKMHALQLSERGGKIGCEDLGDRVLISGTARTYSAGHFWVE